MTTPSPLPSPTSRPVNLAVAGAGLIGREHIRVIAANTDCRLAAIIDPSPAAQEIARQHQARCYPDLDALFADQANAKANDAGKVDAVVLATPNQFHHAHAQQCIARNLPILLEKPIAATVEEALDVVQQAEQRKVAVLIGHHRAHSPIMARAQEIIQQGCRAAPSFSSRTATSRPGRGARSRAAGRCC